jgi:hypothetical protein
MKHVRTISRVNLSQAQASTTDIITAVVSILTAIGSLLGIIVPGVQDKQK